MASMVLLLGAIAILLTAAGSYRFSVYFFDQGLFPVLISAAATVSFILLFPYIILLSGLAVVLLPIGLLVNQSDYQPNLPQQTSDVGSKGRAIVTGAVGKITSKTSPEDKSSGNDDRGKLNPYDDGESNKVSTMCPQCGKKLEVEDPKICGYCGTKLGE